MQKVDRNEKILTENVQRLNKMIVDEVHRMHTQIDSVMMVNENIQQIQSGIEECQHTFEILVGAFLHAKDAVIQPQLITITKIKDMMRRESLPDGLDFPSFPSLQLSRLITLISYSQYSYLVYRVSQEECARLREGVPYVKVYRYNPKHLCPKLNGYGDNGQRSLKL